MKKGFTLIELLAVIVILAIIAMIATPIVLSIIDDAKKSSLKATLNNIEKAVNFYYHKSPLAENKIFECNNDKCEDDLGNKLELEGKIPSSGSINISKTGHITYDSIILDGYLCDKYDGEFICNKIDNNIINTKEESIVINNLKDSLSNYKIYGNSIQDGTPTIEAPIEIESVEEKTKNLADLSKTLPSTSTSYTTFDFDNTTGTLELTSEPNMYDYTLLYLERDLGVKFEVGKTYYYGANVTISGKKTSGLTAVAFGVSHDGAGASLFAKYYTKDGSYNMKGEFTYTGETNVRLFAHFNYGSIEPAQVKFENIYVSEVDEFEPYGKYKIPVKASGKNLFDGVLKNGQFSWGEDSAYRRIEITLEAGTYTISSSSSLFKQSTNISFVKGSQNFTDNTFTLTETTDCYFQFRGTDERTEEFYNSLKIQIERDTITEYEPYQELTTNIYLDEPLRKVGNYVDYIDYKNKLLVKNVGVLKLVGEENWEKENDYYSLKLDSYPKLDKEISISNYLEYGKSFWYEKNELKIKIEGINDIETFKHWLKNNHVEIYYPMNKSIISDIDLSEINLNKNYSNLKIETNIKPSRSLIEYD